MNSLGAFELEKRLRKVLVSLSANKVLKFVLQISKLFMKFKSFHTFMIYIKIRPECLYINIFDSW